MSEQRNLERELAEARAMSVVLEHQLTHVRNAMSSLLDALESLECARKQVLREDDEV